MDRFQRVLTAAALAAALVCPAAESEPFDFGEAFADASFWKADPVLFVKKHEERGFKFTSDAREGADSRQDGAVTCFGIPVFESKVAFAEEGGIARVELQLYNQAGTEKLVTTDLGDGRRMRRLERVEKTLTRTEFFEMLEKLRTKLTPSGVKIPAAKTLKGGKDGLFEKAQTWPKTDVPTVATLIWNYSQKGKNTMSFRPGYIRLDVEGPANVAAKKAAAAKDVKKSMAENVVRDPRGDVFIDNVPMVDQGAKGYCAVAAAERVLRYYGVDVDEHQLAQAAGTKAEGGTSTLGMKNSVQAIGRKYKLATQVAYGDFEKSSDERIKGIVKEVANYNKVAKKLRKKEIGEDVYVTHQGNVTCFDPGAVDEASDPEVLREMKVNGPQKAKYVKFLKDVHDQVNRGIPLFWGVRLGTYPEPEIPQVKGGHIRLIIGYNDRKKEILYTDSWGAGHELKRMPADWAWTISHCLLYLKPLSR